MICSTPALAWGPQGHALIADIAAAHLSPAASAQVARLLARDGHDHLDEIASWADAIRHQRRGTGRWHYVDIPLDASHYEAARDCPHANCVIARLAAFAHVLGDRHAAPAARVEALKFVVHLVGDVHQPMHAEDDHDKGGNDVRLTYFGRRRSLHSIWDGVILDRALGLTVHRHYTIDYGPTRRTAARLDGDITARQRRIWSRAISAETIQRAATRWADQAHRLARTVAYGDLPAPPRRNWSGTYQQAAWPVVRRQIERAGVRLAVVLNAELGS